MTLRVHELRLHTLELPLVAPFTTSFGTELGRTALIVEARTDGGVGWGECVALSEPIYSSEYVDGAREVIRRFLLPGLSGAVTAQQLGGRWEPIIGHRMAKAAVEMAVLDAQLRTAGQPFATYLGVSLDFVPSGVSVGIHDSVPALLDTVDSYLQQGYRRIKLKIKPGWDVEPVRAVRERFGDIALQVDANAAYGLSDAATLRKLDAFDLLLIEQPLAEDDLRQHAELAKSITTPVCLDESIVSARAAADAITLGAAAVINIKPGRVGGYLEAVRIHDLARAHGIAVWCGGMLETGIGRAANIALAGLPGFTLIGDVSASDRFYTTDVTPPVVMVDGQVPVYRGPGLCEQPIPELLERFRVDETVLTV